MERWKGAFAACLVVECESSSRSNNSLAIGKSFIDGIVVRRAIMGILDLRYRAAETESLQKTRPVLFKLEYFIFMCSITRGFYAEEGAIVKNQVHEVSSAKICFGLRERRDDTSVVGISQSSHEMN